MTGPRRTLAEDDEQRHPVPAVRQFGTDDQGFLTVSQAFEELEQDRVRLRIYFLVT